MNRKTQGGRGLATGLMSRMFLWVLCGAIAAASFADTPGFPPAKAAPPPAQTSGAAMTAADIDALLEGIVPAQLAREDIAGAVVIVVKDGAILFSKGYGFADVEKRKPVSVDDTLFRPGSTSKLFTWTAVMQLVEQGKLDLDKDVNTYIDFKIPEAFGKPITLRDAMTHTSGFEEGAKDLFAASASDMPPLGRYLATHVPARIFAPGTTPAYSNYATALAGYIVERVSGKPFADYIEEFVTGPLGMVHASFQQPLPKDLEPLMSNGYKLASEKPEGFEFVTPAPAGALSASAGAMARFMIAHLQNGVLGSARILRPETAELMHARQRGKSPDMNAMALGFYEESRNGHRIISHGGDTMWFHSDLHLVLDAGVGFFVSYNSAGKGEVSNRTLLWHAFLDRYFPYEVPAASPSATAEADIKAVTGSYISSRRGDTNFLRLVYLLTPLVVSPAQGGGAIQIDQFKAPSGKLLRFEPVGPMAFQEAHGQSRVVFVKDAAGRLELVMDYPFFVFTRQPALLDKGFLLPAAIGSLAVLVLTVILWPVGAILRRHYKKRLELAPGERRWRLWARLVCLLDVVLVGAFGAILTIGFGKATLLSARLDPWLHVMQGLALLALLGGAIALVNAFLSWAGSRGIWSKLGETLIALACLGMAWLILAGQLLHVGPTY